MNVIERVEMCRLLEMMKKNEEFSRKIGLEDVSKFREETVQESGFADYNNQEKIFNTLCENID